MGRLRSNLCRCAAVLSAAIAICSVSAVASAAGTGGYSVRPVEIDQKDPATRAYFKPMLKPGSSTTLHVEVKNRDKQTLHLRVDAVDGLTGQTTGSVYANRQDPVTKAGTWVTPSVHDLFVGSMGTATVAFRVIVPSDVVPGDHLAGIAFENAAVQTSSGSFSVREIVREVVGIQIRVPGAAAKHLTIGALGLQSLPGTAFASVTVNLSNDGQLLCKPVLTVDLRGPNGRARAVTRQLDTILPGDSIPYPLAWPDAMPAGKYTARASTTGCGPAATTTEVPLVLGAPLNGTQPRTEPAPRTLGFPFLYIVLAAGVAVIGLLSGLLLGKRRRRDEEWQAPIPVPVARRVKLEPTPPVSVRAEQQPEQQSFWP